MMFTINTLDMNIMEIREYLNQCVEYLDEERADLTIYQKHDLLFAECELIMDAVKKREGDNTHNLWQLRRMINSALMNFGGGVY